MSESKARARRKTAQPPPPSPPAEVVVQAETPQVEEPQYPGVAILRVPTDTEGSENLQIIPLGGMDPLSIPTLLKLAINIQESNMGLGNQNSK